jgi:hypothetical protein
MQCEKRKHAGVPISDPVSLFFKNLVLDIKAPAGGTQICTGAAVDARKGHVIPEWCVKKLSLHLVP